jgi:hypothetical protein
MSYELPASLPVLIQRVLDIKASRVDNVVFDSTLSLRQFLGTLIHQDSYQQGHYQYEACPCKHPVPPALVNYRIDRRTSGKGVLPDGWNLYGRNRRPTSPPLPGELTSNEPLSDLFKFRVVAIQVLFPDFPIKSMEVS